MTAIILLDTCSNYIHEIKKKLCDMFFGPGVICFSVHCTTKLVFHVTVTPMPIYFIFDTAIDDPEWKKFYRFVTKSENQNGWWRPFRENMMKKVAHAITLTEMKPFCKKSCFDICNAIEGDFQPFKVATSGHFVNKKL